MYSTFSSFLQTDTWHSHHDTDVIWFMQMLGDVIDHPDFDPDAMGDYFLEKLGIGSDQRGEGLALAVDKYVADAWAVKEFLTATGR
jgi:hypothetical protein